MSEQQGMSERSFDFLDEVLHRYFGPGVGSSPRMLRADVSRLLTDDAQSRLAQARLAALEWANTETNGNVEITSERLVITQHGLLYAAGLRVAHGAVGPAKPPGLPARAGRSFYYLAPPHVLFEPIVDQVDTAAPLLQGAAAAVDDRFGRDLASARLLNAALRQLVDAHEVVRLDLTEDDRSDDR